MGFPAFIPVVGIPGDQGSCKLPSPWVMWLSLGLHPTRKDEVHGQSQLGHPKKQRRQTPELLTVVSVARGCLDCRQWGFGWFPSKLAGF